MLNTAFYLEEKFQDSDKNYYFLGGDNLKSEDFNQTSFTAGYIHKAEADIRGIYGVVLVNDHFDEIRILEQLTYVPWLDEQDRFIFKPRIEERIWQDTSQVGFRLRLHFAYRHDPFWMPILNKKIYPFFAEEIYYMLNSVDKVSVHKGAEENQIRIALRIHLRDDFKVVLEYINYLRNDGFLNKQIVYDALRINFLLSKY